MKPRRPLSHTNPMKPKRVKNRAAHFGFDLGGFIADSASTAGDIVTHPADDINWAVSTSAPALVNQVAAHADKLDPSIGDFVRGPVNDFLKSKVGQVLLPAFLPSLAIGEISGAALMYTAMDLASGGFWDGNTPFAQAWVDGFTKRLKDGAKILGADANFNIDLGISVPPDVQNAIDSYSQLAALETSKAGDFLKTLSPVDLSSMTPEALANHLSIRLDDASWALAGIRQNPTELAQVAASHFDPQTGNLLSEIEWRAKTQPNPLAQVGANSRLATMGLSIDQKAAQDAGAAMGLKSQIFNAGRVMVKTSAYTKGYDTAVGMVTSGKQGTQVSATLAAQIANMRNFLANGDEKKGFDMGLAAAKGYMQAAPSLQPGGTKAAMAVLMGIKDSQMPDAAKAAIVNTVSSTAGGNAAIALMNKPPPVILAAQPKGWVETFLSIFGL